MCAVKPTHGKDAKAANLSLIHILIPDMNGIEIVRQIRKVIGKSCPIIILTAYDLSLIHICAAGWAETLMLLIFSERAA